MQAEGHVPGARERLQTPAEQSGSGGYERVVSEAGAGAAAKEIPRSVPAEEMLSRNRQSHGPWMLVHRLEPMFDGDNTQEIDKWRVQELGRHTGNPPVGWR